jgi:hypothetical protein
MGQFAFDGRPSRSTLLSKGGLTFGITALLRGLALRFFGLARGERGIPKRKK